MGNGAVVGQFTIAPVRSDMIVKAGEYSPDGKMVGQPPTASNMSFPLYAASQSAPLQHLSQTGFNQLIQTSVNDSGAIVGYSLLSTQGHLIYWSSATAAPKAIATIPGSYIGAAEIDNNGRIAFTAGGTEANTGYFMSSISATPVLVGVGTATLTSSGAILCGQQNSWSVFTTPKSSPTVLNDVSGKPAQFAFAGHNSIIVGGGTANPLYWQPATGYAAQILPTLPNWTTARAESINATGQISGQYTDYTGTHACYWPSITSAPIAFALGAFSVQVTDAPLIFDSGIILATDGQSGSYLLSPSHLN
jgi:hypothetical protein